LGLALASEETGKAPLCDECLTDGEEVRIIDREHPNGDTPNSGSRGQLGSGPREMLSPLVPPRVEQSHDFPGDRVVSSDIRAFMPIAVQTSQGKIFETGRTPCCCAMM
jgi:hypothetical protein